MADTLFYIFSTLTLLCGLLVVFNPFSRNPVTSAMFLVLTIISLSGLFVLLQAYFLAAVQILVYAGAVIVLFLFVIMLMELKESEFRRYRKFGTAIGLLSVIGIGCIITGTVRDATPLKGEVITGETHELGKLLFTDYLLPFEIVSVLLLVAMIGCILLSKRGEAPE